MNEREYQNKDDRGGGENYSLSDMPNPKFESVAISINWQFELLNREYWYLTFFFSFWVIWVSKFGFLEFRVLKVGSLVFGILAFGISNFRRVIIFVRLLTKPRENYKNFFHWKWSNM